MENGHCKTYQEVADFFGTDLEKGLTPEQVKRLTEKYGPNGKSLNIIVKYCQLFTEGRDMFHVASHICTLVPRALITQMVFSLSLSLSSLLFSSLLLIDSSYNDVPATYLASLTITCLNCAIRRAACGRG